MNSEPVILPCFIAIIMTTEREGKIQVRVWSCVSDVCICFVRTDKGLSCKVYNRVTPDRAVARQVFGFGQRSRMTSEGDTNAR